jgi:hypothetical protein
MSALSAKHLCFLMAGELAVTFRQNSFRILLVDPMGSVQVPTFIPSICNLDCIRNKTASHLALAEASSAMGL